MPSKNMVDFANQVKSYAFGIKDQQVLGAWNLWDNTITLSNNGGGTNTKTSDGYDIQCTTTNYSGSFFDRATVRSKYTQYGTIRLSFEYKSDIACSAQVGASPHVNSGTLPTIWTKYDEVFDASTIDHIVFYNRDTTKAPKISIRNIMISLPTSADLPYVAPTMTNKELTDKKVYKGVINSSIDLNNVRETGIYYVDTGNAHRPENNSYFTLIVEYEGANSLRQFAIRHDVLYARKCAISNDEWTSWYKFTGTEVS